MVKSDPKKRAAVEAAAAEAEDDDDADFQDFDKADDDEDDLEDDDQDYDDDDDEDDEDGMPGGSFPNKVEEFAGFEVSDTQELTYEGDPGSTLHITHMAVTPETTEPITLNATTLNSEGEEVTFVLATLRPGQVDQIQVDLKFPDAVVISVAKGKGTVHIIGTVVTDLRVASYTDMMDEDDEDFDEDLEDEEDEDDEDDEGPRIELLEDEPPKRKGAVNIPITSSEQTAKRAKTDAAPAGEEKPQAAKKAASGAAAAGSDSVDEILAKIMASPSKPKKEDKFRNFCKATFKITDDKVLNQLWAKYSASQK